MTNPDTKKERIPEIEPDIILDYVQEDEKINIRDNVKINVLDTKPEINVPESVQNSLPDFKPDGKVDPIYQHKDGRFRKGITPNPGGRPKSEGFHKLLKKIFGENSEELVYLLLAQMTGAQIDLDQKRINEILPEHLRKYFKKAKASDVDKKLQSDNIKWLIERMQGKLLSEIKAENTIRTDEDTKWRLEITHVNHNNNIKSIDN